MAALQQAGEQPQRNASLMAAAARADVERGVAARIPHTSVDDADAAAGADRDRAQAPPGGARESPTKRRESPQRRAWDSTTRPPEPAEPPGGRKGRAVRYADVEPAGEGAQARGGGDGGGVRRGGAPQPHPSDSFGPLPIRVAPEWAFRSGRHAGGAVAHGASKRDVEAAVTAAAEAEEEEFEVIDRASCCWRCARLTVLLLFLSVNNFVVAICGAYLARSAWFDDWFNGTGLSALSKRLAVTVPRCNADALLELSLAAVNATLNATSAGGNATSATGTNATNVTLVEPPLGSLYANSRGRVCGFYD